MTAPCKAMVVFLVAWSRRRVATEGIPRLLWSSECTGKKKLRFCWNGDVCARWSVANKASNRIKTLIVNLVE